jgi:hypothetical protein
LETVCSMRWTNGGAQEALIPRLRQQLVLIWSIFIPRFRFRALLCFSAFQVIFCFGIFVILRGHFPMLIVLLYSHFNGALDRPQ